MAAARVGDQYDSVAAAIDGLPRNTRLPRSADRAAISGLSRKP
ncbi:hypothetical protein [Streptomyces albipurpureus]|nr:hypothetical protein [Streptomyces sp. CWNU-1]